MNAPLDFFDETFPLYGKYRKVLERAIGEFSTTKALRVKEILNAQGTISDNTKMPNQF